MGLKTALQEIKYYIKLEGFSRPIKKFLLYKSPLSRLVNTSLYNRIYYRQIKKQSSRIKPKILQIETTNACNAKCIMCPHKIMKRKIRLMNMEEFRKVLDNVMKNYDIDRLTINGFGEPLTDKRIIEKIKYVNKKYPRLKVDIYTNAALLTKEKTGELLRTRLGRITFSINGTEKSYKKVMGLDYDNVRRNVLYFLKQKRLLKNPVLANVSMMILQENRNHEKEHINFWRKYADSVRVYYTSDWAGALRENLGLQEIPYGRKQWPCSALWTHIVIHSNGEFVVCCRDYESRVQFGNLLKGNDIRELRESKKFRGLQKQHLKFDFSSPICRNCDHAYDSSIEWWLW